MHNMFAFAPNHWFVCILSHQQTSIIGNIALIHS